MHGNLNQDSMGFYYDDIAHVLLTTKWPQEQTPLSSISVSQWCKRSSWFHQINTFHSRLERRGWIINHHICCRLRPMPTTSLYRLNHFCLFTISSVAMFVCVSKLKNLVISLPAPRQRPRDLIHWAAIQKTAWNSVELWTVFTVAICKLLCTKNWDWSRGMMAKLCDAGHSINKSFDWTTFIKAYISVACFLCFGFRFVCKRLFCFQDWVMLTVGLSLHWFLKSRLPSTVCHSTFTCLYR